MATTRVDEEGAAAPVCLVCGSGAVDDLGPVAHYQPAIVGSVEIDLGATEYRQIACTACGFEFKWPHLPVDDLLQGYSATDEAHWGAEPDPRQRRYDLIKALVDRHAAGPRVLDVGCANGLLLRYLGPSWERFGIEPSLAAGKAAGEAGIAIVGHTLDDTEPALDGTFDVILAIDVVEHVPEPMPFFRRIRDLLAPGGIFVLVTGDTDALTWRLEKTSYWYSAYAGHVSFFSQRSLGRLASVVGLESVETVRRPHGRSRLRRVLRQAAANGSWLLHRAATRVAGRRPEIAPAPDWSSARDHLFQVLRLPAR